MSDSTKQLREDLDWYVKRVAHYGEENARLRADNQTLRSFARLIIQEGPWQGADLDGSTIQEWAETAGLIKCVPFDPEKHITRSNYEDIVDVGEDWYVLAGPLAPASCDGNRDGEDPKGLRPEGMTARCHEVADAQLSSYKARIEELEYSTFHCAWLEQKRRGDAALSRLSEMEKALERIADLDVVYPPHDPGNYFPPEGKEGRFAKIARSALRSKQEERSA